MLLRRPDRQPRRAARHARRPRRPARRRRRARQPDARGDRAPRAAARGGAARARARARRGPARAGRGAAAGRAARRPRSTACVPGRRRRAGRRRAGCARSLPDARPLRRRRRARSRATARGRRGCWPRGLDGPGRAHRERPEARRCRSSSASSSCSSATATASSSSPSNLSGATSVNRRAGTYGQFDIMNFETSPEAFGFGAGGRAQRERAAVAARARAGRDARAHLPREQPGRVPDPLPDARACPSPIRRARRSGGEALDGPSRPPRRRPRRACCSRSPRSLTFVFLNSRFEGPGDPIKALSGPTQLTATFAEHQEAADQAARALQGPRGRARQQGRLGRRTAARREVTFTIDDDFELHEDAVLRIGERSLLGDPFLDVVTRGSQQPADARRRRRGRQHADERELRRGARLPRRRRPRATCARSCTPSPAASPTPRHDERLNGDGRRAVADDRRGARADARACAARRSRSAGSSRARRPCSTRSAAARTRCARSSARAARRSTRSRPTRARSSRASPSCPRLLDAGRRSLDAARPLVAELRAPVRKLRALSARPRRARWTRRAVLAARDRHRPRRDPRRAARRCAAPPCRSCGKDVRAARSGCSRRSSRRSQPAGAQPRARAGVPRRRRGRAPRAPRRSPACTRRSAPPTRARTARAAHYTRAGFTLDLAELARPAGRRLPATSGFCNNAYPKSGDALDPQPFEGEYPRITECQVPPRTRPTEPCK